jgi:hypothetical protein
MKTSDLIAHGDYLAAAEVSLASAGVTIVLAGAYRVVNWVLSEQFPKWGREKI